MDSNTIFGNVIKILLRVLRKTGFLNHLNLALPWRHQGKIFRIPVLATVGIEHFFCDQETWMQPLLQSLRTVTRGEGTFIDVGVNIGQTLLKVKSVDDDWDYVGFEPNPTCIHYLHVLINRNKFSNVTVLPFGLADKTAIGNLNFFSKGPADSYASIVPEFRSNMVGSMDVAIMNGEEISDKIAKTVVFKIDVEGAELEVVRGLRSVIARDQPFIICEILPIYEASNHFRLTRQLELERLIDDLNYVKYKISREGKLIPCHEIGIHDDIEQVNYLFVHRAAAGLLNNKVHLMT